MTEESEVKARWAGYFEWLYQANPPAVDLDVMVVTIPITMPGVGLMVRVAGFGSEGPEFKSRSAVESR